MKKEKFDCNKEYANIGTIGHVDHGKTTLISAINFAISNREKYNQQVLDDLIEQYGEEEGLRRFKEMLKEAKERYEEIQKLDIKTDDESKSSGLKK